MTIMITTMGSTDFPQNLKYQLRNALIRSFQKFDNVNLLSYSKSIQFDRDNIPIAFILRMNNQHEAADKMFDRVITQQINSNDYYALSESYTENGETKIAYDYFNKLINERPFDPLIEFTKIYVGFEDIRKNAILLRING